VLKSAEGRCLAVADGKPVMKACVPGKAQQWDYTLAGNVVSAEDHQCLSATGPDSGPQGLDLEACGHNRPDQIWSLPN
jgi:alpha-galactosidase